MTKMDAKKIDFLKLKIFDKRLGWKPAPLSPKPDFKTQYTALRLIEKNFTDGRGYGRSCQILLDGKQYTLRLQITPNKV